jgi:hypothetical protein
MYFEPQSTTFVVDAFRGVSEPRRVFGRDMGKAQALKRAALVARIFPEYASPRVTPRGGEYKQGA